MNCGGGGGGRVAMGSEELKATTLEPSFKS